ncbi:MAG TPA: hypothetical protein VEF04_04500 [Blastocatellia bacterium]|nr:hypothetical protein [Blastocatellia bacterium]
MFKPGIACFICETWAENNHFFWSVAGCVGLQDHVAGRKYC